MIFRLIYSFPKRFYKQDSNDAILDIPIYYNNTNTLIQNGMKQNGHNPNINKIMHHIYALEDGFDSIVELI